MCPYHDPNDPDPLRLSASTYYWLAMVVGLYYLARLGWAHFGG